MQALNAALPYVVLLQLVVSLGLAVLVFGLARQIGVLHERVAPMGAMTSDQGPQVGEAAPRLSAATLDGIALELGGPSPDGRSQLLLFVAPSCPVCKKLLPIARSFARTERMRLTLVGDGEPAAQRALIQQFGLEAVPYVSSAHIGLTYQVGKLPHAVLIDPAGIIRAKGLVNTREHLESLLNAEESGYATIQAYLAAAARAAPARSTEVSET